MDRKGKDSWVSECMHADWIVDRLQELKSSDRLSLFTEFKQQNTHIKILKQLPIRLFFSTNPNFINNISKITANRKKIGKEPNNSSSNQS
jgi:hypothetical protein